MVRLQKCVIVNVALLLRGRAEYVLDDVADGRTVLGHLPVDQARLHGQRVAVVLEQRVFGPAIAVRYDGQRFGGRPVDALHHNVELRSLVEAERAPEHAVVVGRGHGVDHKAGRRAQHFRPLRRPVFDVDFVEFGDHALEYAPLLVFQRHRRAVEFAERFHDQQHVLHGHRVDVLVEGYEAVDGDVFEEQAFD